MNEYAGKVSDGNRALIRSRFFLLRLQKQMVSVCSALLKPCVMSAEHSPALSQDLTSFRTLQSAVLWPVFPSNPSPALEQQFHMNSVDAMVLTYRILYVCYSYISSR